MPITFSIIIPTYNRAEQLHVAINSVVAQGWQDWELIIVDDGSQDKTKDVVLPYTDDARIRYYYQTNKELNGARNTGVRLARGAYCCFLDDDDYYESNHLEELSAAIASTRGNHGIYRTNMRIVGDGIDLVAPSFDNEKDALLQLWLIPRNLLPLAIRKDLLVNQPFDEDDLLIDDFVWLNSALITTTLFQTDPVTTYYVQHETNRSKLYHSVGMLPGIVSKLNQAYLIPGVSERVNKSLLHLRIQHQYMHLARLLGQRGLRVKALRTWYQGILKGGLRPARNTLKTLAIILIG